LLPHPPHSTTAESIEVELETDLSRPFVVGRGSILVLRGWCHHPSRTIVRAEVLVDGEPVASVEHGLASIDAFPRRIPVDASGSALASGFVAMVPFAQIAAPQTVTLAMRVHVTGGGRTDVYLGGLQLLPDARDPMPLPIVTKSAPPEPLIVICLTTYRPPLDLLARQLDSIVAQTHRHWICIISDDASSPETWEEIQRLAARDARFFAFRNAERLGFYRNFERAMARVPAGVDYVALSDQDDFWYPEKLAACLAEFRPETTLVYCDMDIVTREGKKLSSTYWTTRRNNFTNFETLLFSNTVTGAASVFRADLLLDVLPFPEQLGAFHDHWIASVAMARGELGYVDRPLYAYTQHGSNVLGQCLPDPIRLGSGTRRLLRSVVAGLKARGEAREDLRALDHRFRNDLSRVVMMARTLAMRAPDAARSRQAVMRRFSTFDRSLAGLAWEGIKYELTGRPSLGVEWLCLLSVVGHRLYNAYYRASPAGLLDRMKDSRVAAGSISA
jgi:glycosyltransferase involved in cell wall biosynthesis